MIAVGIGCRRGTDAASILAAIAAAGTTMHEPFGCIATAMFKQDEGGIVGAADHLGLPLRLIDPADLASVLPDVTVRSVHADRHVGVASVAEAAALAAAGPGARLIVPRRILSGVTCAIAIGNQP